MPLIQRTSDCVRELPVSVRKRSARQPAIVWKKNQAQPVQQEAKSGRTEHPRRHMKVIKENCP